MFRNLLLKGILKKDAKSNHEDKKNIKETAKGDTEETATLSTVNKNNYICNDDARDSTNCIKTDNIEEMKINKQNYKNEIKDTEIGVEYIEESNRKNSGDKGDTNDDDIHNVDVSMEETSSNENDIEIESIGLQSQNEPNLLSNEVSNDYDRFELVHNELTESDSDNIVDVITAGVPEQINKTIVDPGYDTNLEIKSVLEKKCRKIKKRLEKRLETESNKKEIINVALTMMNGINDLRKEGLAIFDNIQEIEVVTEILDKIKNEMEDLIRKKLEYIYTDKKFIPFSDMMKAKPIKGFNKNDNGIENGGNESGEYTETLQNFKREEHLEGNSEMKNISHRKNEESLEDLDNIYFKKLQKRKSTKSKGVQNKEKTSTLNKRKRNSKDQLYMELKENLDFSFNPELKNRVENQTLSKEELKKLRRKLENKKYSKNLSEEKRNLLRERKRLYYENQTQEQKDLKKMKHKVRQRYLRSTKSKRVQNKENIPTLKKRKRNSKDQLYMELKENLDFSFNPDLKNRIENHALSKEELKKLRIKLKNKKYRRNLSEEKKDLLRKKQREQKRLYYENQTQEQKDLQKMKHSRNLSEEKKDLLRKKRRERQRLYYESQTPEQKDLQKMKLKLRQRYLRHKETQRKRNEKEKKIYMEIKEKFNSSLNPELKYRLENHTLGKEELYKLKWKLYKRRQYEKIIANAEKAEAWRKRRREHYEKNKPLREMKNKPIREMKSLENIDKIYKEIGDNFDFSGDPYMQYHLEHKTLSKQDIRKLQKKLWSRRWYERTRANTENGELMEKGKVKYEEKKLRRKLKLNTGNKKRLYRENQTLEQKELQKMKNKIRRRHLRNKEMQEHIKVLKMRELIKQEHKGQIKYTTEGIAERNHFEEKNDSYDEFMNINNEGKVYEDSVEYFNSKTNEFQDNEITDSAEKDDESSPQNLHFFENESQENNEINENEHGEYEEVLHQIKSEINEI